MATKGYIGEITAMMLRMASAPDGTTLGALSDALSTTTTRASARIGQLRQKGLIFNAKVKGAGTHYFTTAEAAEAWRRRQQKPRKEPAWGGLVLPGTPTYIKPKRTMDPRPAEAIAALSKGWAHDPRFQCAPGEQPFGAGFAAAGIGRYLD